MKKVIIIGANSEIGLACAEEFYKRNIEVVLAAHKTSEIQDKRFKTIQFNVIEDSFDKLDHDVDAVLYSAGTFTNNEEALKKSVPYEDFKVNFKAPTGILSKYAIVFKERGYGTIAGITSVAAVRGKASTVYYGASKAGFDSFLAGLRSFYFPSVKVLTFRLGYVNTKMTKELNLPGFLTASKEKVAKSIVNHILKGRRNIVYAKSIWRPIAFIIKNIPEGIFKRLKL